MNTALEHPSPNNKKTGEVLVRADNVGKIFCRDLKRSLLYGVQDGVGDLIPGVGRKYDANGNPILRKGEFWANQGISFELRRGECLGLIGRNGAGKTTLLKMLNGLIKPDTGRIEMRGKVGAIIALGAGFNPLLTGRENVYIAASVRGLSKKEIDEKYDEIVDFAELHDFMDSPVQNYSSGMQVRLGFAVASVIKPDILIIDEVLAVGDFSFRMKCYDTIRSILPYTAVIFVSHQMDQVRRICTHGIYLQNGICSSQGILDAVVMSYEQKVGQNINPDHYIHPIIEYANIIIESNNAEFNSPFSISLQYKSKENLEGLIARVIFTNHNGEVAGEWNSIVHKKQYQTRSGENNEIRIIIPSLAIRPGSYKLSFILSPSDNKSNIIHISHESHISINGPSGIWNLRQL